MELSGDCLTLENIQEIIDENAKEAKRVREPRSHFADFKDHNISQWIFNQSLIKRINESLKRIYIKKELRALKKIYKEVS